MSKQLRPWRKTGKFNNCGICNKSFYIPKHMVKAGTGNFCSRDCYHEWRKGRPMHPNTRKSLTGLVPWNKGLKAKDDERIAKSLEACHKSKKPPAWNKGIRYGKSNWLRLTDKNRYRNIHKRIRKKFGKPIECEKCSSTRKIQWANISSKYTEDREDWIRLCPKCHTKMDKPSQHDLYIEAKKQTHENHS